jgi:hypothetical protein
MANQVSTGTPMNSDPTSNVSVSLSLTERELQKHRARVRTAHKLMFYWLLALLAITALAYFDVGANTFPHWYQVPFGISFVALLACNVYWVVNDLKYSESASPDTLNKLSLLSEVVPAVASMLKEVQAQHRAVTNAEADSALEHYRDELTKHLDACLRKP